MIVDQHQPVVEKYYGPGKMTSVLKRLLEECDKVTKTYIEGWEEERSMKRKASMNIFLVIIPLTQPSWQKHHLRLSKLSQHLHQYVEQRHR